jgi:hypothetical protein
VHPSEDKPAADALTPVEKRVEKSYEDPFTSQRGKPLSRRQRQTRRTLESYLKGGVLPRYMQRVREIEQATERHLETIERTYRRLSREHGEDEREFAERWRAIAAGWNFEKVNELIRQHNDWYPIESGLPMDPRTRDYVRIRGRSYLRSELGAAWVLERFPPVPLADEDAA